MEFGDRSSEKYSQEIKDIECPICKKGKVRVVYIAGYMAWRTSRISAGTKRTKYFHDPKIKVLSNCPSCKATKQEIKDFLESGYGKLSHEERIKRIKESGLPTRLEF